MPESFGLDSHLAPLQSVFWEAPKTVTHTGTITALARGSVVLAAALTLACGTPAAAEADFKDIASEGPLEHIYIGEDLRCQVKHALDEDLSFFPPSAIPGNCGTFLAAEATVFTPDCCVPGVPFTPVSQSEVMGAGTPADPYRVVTVVDAEEAGLRLTETDSYVVGSESYRTDIHVQARPGNEGQFLAKPSRRAAAAPTPIVVYHAADCFLQSSDFGYGLFDSLTGGIYCSLTPSNSPAERVEGFAPITPGSHYIEDFYSTVWGAINGAELPDTAEPDVFQDNGAGLSWSAVVPDLGSVTRSLQTGFSPSGVVIAPQCSDGTDNDGDGATDHPTDRGCESPTDNDEADPVADEASPDLEPELAAIAVVKPRGEVNVLTPGAEGCTSLESASEIPLKSIIDVINGEVRVVTEGAVEGSRRAADFSEGVFKLRQREKNGFLTDAKLVNLSPCQAEATGSKVAGTQMKKKAKGLFGSGSSGHRTTGRGGSASVRGTKWVTVNLPRGRTLFRCIKGRLRIRDYILHKTVFILEGESYTTGQG